MAQARKTALVTGAAKRIGKAIVEDLAAHGFSVAIHCHESRTEADELARSILSAGGRAAVVQADLTDMRAASALLDHAAGAVGPIRLLVNNASTFEEDTAYDIDWAAWDSHFALHLNAPAMLSMQLARSLPQDEEGLVVNIIDQRVLRPSPRYFSYALSKSALWSATQMMAQALAPRVRVNAIGPGPTLPSARQQPADFAAQIDGLLLGRGPQLSEFGATIRYLWETRSVTGQMIAVDGGQHLAWETPDVKGIVE